MKKSIVTLIYIVVFTTLLLLCDYLFSIYNGYFYFALSNKNIIPALVYAILISLIKSKLYRNIAIGIVMFFITIQMFYYQYFGEYLQPIAFIQFYNNMFEVTESFFPVIHKMVIPLLISITISFILIFLSSKFDKLLFNFKYSSFIILFGVFSNLVLTYSYINNSNGVIYHWQAKALYPSKNELSLFNFNKSLNYLLVGLIPQKIFGGNFNFPTLQAPSIKHESDANIVLVIGESLRHDRLSLWGYETQTTPKLDSLSKLNLLKFRIVYCGGTMTKTAVATLMNRLKYPGLQQVIEKKNNLFHLAKANGFRTHFISAQKSESLEILEPLLGMSQIDNYINRTMFNKKSEALSGYDNDLLIYLKKIDLTDNNFIVLQQRGSHSPYNYYPKSYNKFEDSYDNSVVYTDEVLLNIYDYLEQNSKKRTYFIYVSDHGELLGEKGRYGHGWFEPEIYQVPLIAGAINSKENLELTEIDSQYDISNYILTLLGYELVENDKSEKEIFINGSDLEGLAGYMKLTFKNKVLTKEEVFK